MKVVVAQTIEGSCWGAVMIGLDAFGINTNCLDIEEKIFMPNPKHEAVYQENYRKFSKVYEALKNL